jgi:hypothetical protein
MGVTATNLIQGPATIYAGVFGVAEPAKTTAALTAVPGVGWTDVGGTLDGLTWNMNREYSKLMVDQISYRVGTRLTEADDTFETKLAEATLDNLKLILNGGTVTVGATTELGVNNFEPSVDNAATQMTYSALLIDGWAPNGKRRRVIVRKVCASDNASFNASRTDQSAFGVTFAAHYVSSSIRPFQVFDDVTV